jgi:hypothetical protein
MRCPLLTASRGLHGARVTGRWSRSLARIICSTLGAVTSVPGNPRYTGRQVWNRQRTDAELADPADVALGPPRAAQ